MSWKMFGQIALLILLYAVASYASVRVRDGQLTRQYEERRKAISAETEPAALSDSLTAAEPVYDQPPAADDPEAEIMDSVSFRRNAHYRPGSKEDRAQAAAKNWAGD